MTTHPTEGARSESTQLILRAELFHKGRNIIGHTMEITKISAMIRTDESIEIGDRILVRLSFPGLLDPFDVEGHVVSKHLPAGPGEPAGVTVVFVFPTEELEHRFHRLAFEAVPAEGEAEEHATYRVLLVEDSASIRDMLLFEATRRAGGKWRVQIDLAEHAEHGWQMLQESSYQLAIIDHYLPQMRGAELVRRIREDAALSGLPVVGVSIGGAAARDEFLQAGADVFLDKPLGVRHLFNTLDRLLAQRLLGQPRRVLVVDDSPIFLDVATAALEEAGYTVLRAENLEEAERQTAAGPDLVLMDVQMPEAFGDDLAMIMRGMRGVNVPIYLLSSLRDDELRERAREANIDGFISKTAGIGHMIERVRAIFAGRHSPG